MGPGGACGPAAVSAGGAPARIGLLSSALPGASAGEVCEAARRERLDGVEWAFGPGEAVDGSGGGRAAAVIRRAVADAALEVCGVAAQQPDLLSRGDGLGPAVEVAAALGAPHLRVFAPPYAGGDVAAELGALASTLAAAAGRCDAAGVRLLVELSPGTLLPGPAWLLRLADRGDPGVGVVYDPGSMLMEGHVRPPLAVAALAGRVAHVHVKDVAPRRGPAGWRWAHVPLGRGMVPWPEVCAALAGAGYEGWFVVDHLGGEATSEQLRSDVAALRSVLHLEREET